MARRKPKIRIERVYDSKPKRGDYRVLVDRLWPRGLKKDELTLTAWKKEIAPSAALRKWYHANLDEWAEFRKRYFRELAPLREELQDLIVEADGRPIVLLYSSKNVERNNAVALEEYLETKL